MKKLLILSFAITSLFALSACPEREAEVETQRGETEIEHNGGETEVEHD